MTKFEKEETFIKDLYIIKPTIFEDKRGFFMEVYNQREFAEMGLKVEFVQDNLSKSQKGTLRGLHFQTKHPQGKLVKVIKGKVYDVAVDLRVDSKTYGKYYGLILSADNKRMLYIPPGFAHGFLALRNETKLTYKTTDYYYPEYDAGIIWNDSSLAIEWPLEKYKLTGEDLLLSTKDRNLPTLEEMTPEFREAKSNEK